MTILVQIKNVYGKETIYPACEKAKAFCDMLGTKTIPADRIKYIKALGFTINVQPNSVAL